MNDALDSLTNDWADASKYVRDNKLFSGNRLYNKVFKRTKATILGGGLESKLAAGLGPGKAYVKGYEIETIGTTFVDVDKARDTDDANNNKTRFNVKNFVNVDNVYGSPDISFVSGETEAFKRFKRVRGTRA